MNYFKRLKSSIVASAIAASMAMLFPVWQFATWTVCTWSTRPGANSTVTLEGDTLVIAGGIDDGLVHDVQLKLNQSVSPINRLRITSYGGVTDSMTRLASAIAGLGPIPIEVPTTCQSACIGFLANTSGPKHISPSATLMFHSAATTTSPYRETPLCWCWTLLDEIYNLVSPHGHDMLPWSAQLTDRLPVLFALCPINPLDTKHGMFLTGQEYNDLLDGLVTPESLTGRCPSDAS
jgi:hypothetical protein